MLMMMVIYVVIDAVVVNICVGGMDEALKKYTTKHSNTIHNKTQ
jgi:hypothetical protein